MSFHPTRDRLAPDLTDREQIVLLARALWREGYNDHLAGHITFNLGDGTLLCNPWLITGRAAPPHQVIRIDLEGTVVEGDWPAPLGIPLHLWLDEGVPRCGLGDAQSPPLYGYRHGPTCGVVPPPIRDQSSTRAAAQNSCSSTSTKAE